MRPQSLFYLQAIRGERRFRAGSSSYSRSLYIFKNSKLKLHAKVQLSHALASERLALFFDVGFHHFPTYSFPFFFTFFTHLKSHQNPNLPHFFFLTPQRILSSSLKTLIPLVTRNVRPSSPPQSMACILLLLPFFFNFNQLSLVVFVLVSVPGFFFRHFWVC